MEIISVIITTFNSGETIGRLLSSVFNQEGLNSLFSLEVLIADDGSTDNTIALASEFPVAILPSGVNTGGPNAGRNRALAVCKGDFICIADHDDEWMPYRLKKLLPHLKKVPVVSSGFTLADDTTGRVEKILNHSAEKEIYYPVNQTFSDRLTRSKSGQSCYLGSLIFLAELKTNRFEETFGVCDYDWLVRLFRNRESAEVNESLYIRHVEGSNLSLNEGYRRKDYFYSLYFLDGLKDEFPFECKLAEKRLNGSRARYFYLTGKMKEARKYFLKSGFSWLTTAYYLTTFFGSGWVRRQFKIFG